MIDALILLGGLGLLTTLAFLGMTRTMRAKRFRFSERKFFDAEVSSRSSTYLGGPDDDNLSRRRITLKVCPDCHEFVPVTALTCNQCASIVSGLETRIRVACADQPLVLPRKPKQ